MLTRKNPFMIFVEDFEVEAESFLKKYECEDAIDNPQPIPIFDIAQRLMSLDIVQSECLALDGSIQGAIAFTKGTLDVYDWETGEYIGYTTDGPAVFIDSAIWTEGRINNTLAHECYHWWRHRNYFNYRRTHENGPEFGIRCEKAARRHSSDHGEWSDVEKMEWQARTIAPKILMPRKATRRKIEELFSEMSAGSGYEDRFMVAEIVVERLADFFRVSKQSAAIRMLELGYSEAEEFCTYEAVPEIPEQKRQKTRAVKHQQTITLREAFDLYLNNDFLRAIIDTGGLTFAEGYFVIKDKKYVEVNEDGEAYLTNYAKNNLQECTIDFSRKLIGEPYLIHDADAHKMYRKDTVFKWKESCDNTPQNVELYNKVKEYENKYESSKKTHQTAAQKLKEFMDQKGWNKEDFLIETDLDEMTYSRVCNNYDKFTMHPLVTMGFALGLDVLEMERVLNLAGLSFEKTDDEHSAYKYIFTAYAGKSVYECNVFLKEVGVKPLGTQHRK